MWKDIANQVAEKCVDPESQRPYPVGMIEKGMTEAGFSVKIGKSAKSQVCTMSSSIISFSSVLSFTCRLYCALDTVFHKAILIHPVSHS